MRKPLAGYRAFFANGQRAAARYEPYPYHHEKNRPLPLWARLAFYSGYVSISQHRLTRTA